MSSFRRSAWVIGVLAFVAGSACAHGTDLGQYMIILQRQPFGKPAPEPVQETATPLQPSFAEDWLFQGMAVFDGETWISLHNKKEKSDHLLQVGDSHEGVKVLDADFDAEQITLLKGSERVCLSLRTAGSRPLDPTPNPRKKAMHLAAKPGAEPPGPVVAASRGPTIDALLRKNPNALVKGTIPIPPEGLTPAVGKGETIEMLLRELRSSNVPDEPLETN